jgi:hypothetical protein
MKIILTLAELTALVRRTYNVSSVEHLTVEVVVGPAASYVNMMNRFRNIGGLDAENNIRPEQRIACIKVLREMVGGLGLGCSKNAIVDNWDKFRAKAEKEGLPLVANPLANGWDIW